MYDGNSKVNMNDTRNNYNKVKLPNLNSSLKKGENDGIKSRTQ